MKKEFLIWEVPFTVTSLIWFVVKIIAAAVFIYFMLVGLLLIA